MKKSQSSLTALGPFEHLDGAIFIIDGEYSQSWKVNVPSGPGVPGSWIEVTWEVESWFRAVFLLLSPPNRWCTQSPLPRRAEAFSLTCSRHHGGTLHLRPSGVPPNLALQMYDLLSALNRVEHAIP